MILPRHLRVKGRPSRADRGTRGLPATRSSPPDRRARTLARRADIPAHLSCSEQDLATYAENRSAPNRIVKRNRYRRREPAAHPTGIWVTKTSPCLHRVTSSSSARFIKFEPHRTKSTVFPLNDRAVNRREYCTYIGGRRRKAGRAVLVVPPAPLALNFVNSPY